MTDCAGYERLLARLMAGECDETERPEALAELRRHAGDCAACRGTIDLLDVLESPPGERELVDEPDASYWERFDRELNQRIASTPAEASPGWRQWAAAAAAVLIATAGLWALRDGVESRRAGAGREKLPPALERLIRDSGPREALAGLDFLTGLAALPDPSAENGAAVEAMTGTPGDDGWLFPDTDNLDDETRDELLEWLQERDADGQGVRS